MKKWRGLRSRLRQAREAPQPNGGSRGTPQHAGGLSFRVEERLPAPAKGAGPREAFLYFDLETTGLGARHWVFLCGCLFYQQGELYLCQEVAADFCDERHMLVRFTELAGRYPRLVSYNGRSFDAPMLRRRLAYHGLPPLRFENIDLLPVVRRRFRERLEDCRLVTVEREILGICRESGDIPGAEVPLRFLDYKESGERRLLDPVLYHNRMDLTTLEALHGHLAENFEEVGGQRSGVR